MPSLSPSRRRPSGCYFLAMSAAIWPALAAAQSPAPAPPAQRVEIRADPGSERRADVAGRQVVGRADLLRHGDTQLADALQRVPGITVERRGQAVELKLSGLGDGRTLVLLNGEPLPRGVPLDSIALDSLERVEIINGASVETAQAIAGTINLVTRKPTALASRDVRLSLASEWGLPQASATLNLGDAVGAATWGLGLTLSSDRRRWPATDVLARRDVATGSDTQRTRTDKREYDHSDAISLNPRLSWKRGDETGGQWQLSTDHSLRLAQANGGVADRRTPLLGPPPAQQTSDMALNYQRLFWRGRVQAQHQATDGAKTEARVNITYARRDQQARALGYDFDQRLVQDTAVDGLAVDESLVLNLNHQRPLGETHRLSLGAEWEQARRKEDRVQTEQDLPSGLPPDNLDERFDARVQRHAFYLQDEWAPDDRTAMQLGVRMERLETDSRGNVFDTVRQTHSLVGPVLRASWRPGSGRGTVKLGLSRGFKLPAPRDVMPRRYVPIAVSPTSPAQSGNPDLQPERAWSLDASWQDKVAAFGGDMVLSASLRRIDDVMLDRLIAQPAVLNAPWLLQRVNAGRAWSTGLTLELRGQLEHTALAGAPLRWTASGSLARSRLSDVTGPDPALPGQAPWQLKIGLTQALPRGWTAQLGLEARGASKADLPTDRRIENLSRHGLDASLGWQPRRGQTWRLSVAQLAASDDVTLRTVGVTEAGGAAVYTAREAWHRDTVWRFGLDSSF